MARQTPPGGPEGADSQRILRQCGQVVRTQRQALGWTQDQVGERAGVSGNTISELEQGHRWPLMGHLVAIKRVLGLSWARLLPDDPMAVVPEVLVIPVGTSPALVQAIRDLVALYTAMRDPRGER